jgi:hypothetical protein
MPTLRRRGDNAGDAGGRSEAIAWNEDGTLKEVVSDRPTVGCSMLVGSVTARSYSYQDYWLTTVVTEILEDKGHYVKFRTENSIYEWYTENKKRLKIGPPQKKEKTKVKKAAVPIKKTVKKSKKKNGKIS